MPPCKGKGVRNKEGRWQVKSSPDVSSLVTKGESIDGVESVTHNLHVLSVVDQSGQGHVQVAPIQFEGSVSQKQTAVPGQTTIWKPKSHGTWNSATAASVEQVDHEQKGNEAGVCETSGGAALDTLLREKQLEKFTVDNNTYSSAQIRAVFYPKFENEKSDLEVGSTERCYRARIVIGELRMSSEN